MPTLCIDPVLLYLTVALVVLGIPALVAGVVVQRIRSKERARDGYLKTLCKHVEKAGMASRGSGLFQIGKRTVKVEADTNPLFSSSFTVRLAAFSDTVHEFELKRGQPVPDEFSAFKPLLDRWETARGEKIDLL